MVGGARAGIVSSVAAADAVTIMDFVRDIIPVHIIADFAVVSLYAVCCCRCFNSVVCRCCYFVVVSVYDHRRCPCGCRRRHCCPLLFFSKPLV